MPPGYEGPFAKGKACQKHKGRLLAEDPEPVDLSKGKGASSK